MCLTHDPTVCWTTPVPDAAKPTPTRRTGTGAARTGGELFGRPTGPNHRRYEALRGYRYEGLPIESAAARSGYSTATLRSLVRDFRAGKTGFFLNPRPGPTRAPANPGKDPRAAPGRALGDPDLRSPGRHRHPAEPDRRRPGHQRGRPRTPTDPPGRGQRATVPGPPTPRRAAQPLRTPRPIPQQAGRAAAHPA